MKLCKFLSKVKCKLFMCCGSKCSINDTDGDGVLDQVKVETKNQAFTYDTK